jgi:hypothetical protein
VTDPVPAGRAADDSPHLICESCGREADRLAKGWRGLLGREDDDAEVVVVMCPDCGKGLPDEH